MLFAYFNYPNPHVTIHHDPDCGLIRTHDRPQQRTFRINAGTISSILEKFNNKEVRYVAGSKFPKPGF